VPVKSRALELAAVSEPAQRGRSEQEAQMFDREMQMSAQVPPQMSVRELQTFARVRQSSAHEEQRFARVPQTSAREVQRFERVPQTSAREMQRFAMVQRKSAHEMQRFAMVQRFERVPQMSAREMQRFERAQRKSWRPAKSSMQILLGKSLQAARPSEPVPLQNSVHEAQRSGKPLRIAELAHIPVPLAGMQEPARA